MSGKWHDGLPPEHGYYLATWVTAAGGRFVSELWFNPQSVDKWYTCRGYLDPYSSSTAVLTVVAWMRKPEPSEIVTKE